MASSEFIDPAKLDLDDQVVAINRITKVVKGGRRMRFAALVIVGDRKGHVGFGIEEVDDVSVSPASCTLQVVADREHVLVCCGALAGAEIEHRLETLLLEVYRCLFIERRSAWCIVGEDIRLRVCRKSLRGSECEQG